MKIDCNGIAEYSNSEQFEIEYAESEMDRICAIKQDFFRLMLRVDAFQPANSSDFEYGYVAMEEALNDLLLPSFHDAKERAYSFRELPVSTVYKSYKPQFKLRQITNPATLIATGELHA